jgi:hypothetical protein
MITGRLPGTGPSPVKHNHLWLAILLVLVVWGFWGWQLLSGQPLG